MADPLLTKQAVAQRQIDAAIRMLFQHSEDLCAIYTVASAALSVASDLAQKKGVGPTYETRRVFEKVYKDIYDLDLLDPEIAAEVDRRASTVEKHRVTQTHRHRIANFLKHADRDSGKFLEADSLTALGSFYVPNLEVGQASPGLTQVLAMAINYYVNLSLPLTLEMWVYMYWWLGITAQRPEEFVITKAGPVHLFTPEQQIDYGCGLLECAYKVRERNRT